MASTKLLNAYPKFPEALRTAKISEINLTGLASGSEVEAQEVFTACRTSGFFLLNLRGNAAGEKLLKDVEAMFGIAREVMDLRTEEKLKYERAPSRDNLG